MPENCVPLTMGSPKFRSVDVGPFNVVEAWFPAGLVLPRHLHDRTTFAIMLEGSFDVQFSRKTYPCEPAAVFTEPLGEMHGNRVGTKGAHVLVLQPDRDRQQLFEPCTTIFTEVTHFSHTGIRSLAWRLAYEVRSPDSSSRLSLQGLGLEMLAIASRSRRPLSDPPPAWILRAMEVIRSGFRDELDIESVARESGVHPAHLARTFRRYHGESIGSFVRRLRLDWSRERLATTDDPIAAIALEAGFSDQAHLTRLFKRHNGVTPGRFRKVVRS